MQVSWKIIKEVINKKKNTKTELPNPFKENDIEVTYHRKTVERFNKCFFNIGPRQAEKIPKNIMNFASY